MDTKDIKRLLKRVYLINLSGSLPITPMISGQHGIGKSQAVVQCAKELGGYCVTLDGSQTKEGDVVGVPLPIKTADGSAEVTFIRNNKINIIWRLEKYYYEKALTDGFKIGDSVIKAKLDDNVLTVVKVTDGKETIMYTHKSKTDNVVSGDDNIYKFGEEFDFETKLALVNSGEIKPLLLFIDELNRTEQMTMKELMNVILNRDVNGYKLPWWCDVVSAVNPSSQNSSYATNELDAAQMDRFLKLKVKPNAEEWINYALDHKMNNDLIAAIAMSDDVLNTKDSSYEDTDEMKPSSRSWEMVGNILDRIDETNNTKFFDAEEKKLVQDDLRKLMIGKVGDTAARVVLGNIADKENATKPSEILTAKEPLLDKKVLEKFRAQKSLRRTVTVSNVIRYLQENICKYEKKNKSAVKEDKAEYFNFISQIKEFISILDGAEQLSFAKKVTQVDSVKASDGLSLYCKISKCFASDLLKKLSGFKSDLNNLERE